MPGPGSVVARRRWRRSLRLRHVQRRRRRRPGRRRRARPHDEFAELVEQPAEADVAADTAPATRVSGDSALAAEHRPSRFVDRRARAQRPGRPVRRRGASRRGDRLSDFARCSQRSLPSWPTARPEARRRSTAADAASVRQHRDDVAAVRCQHILTAAADPGAGSSRRRAVRRRRLRARSTPSRRAGGCSAAAQREFRATFVPEFVEARSTPRSASQRPVESEFGFHVIAMMPFDELPLDDVSAAHATAGSSATGRPTVTTRSRDRLSSTRSA